MSSTDFTQVTTKHYPEIDIRRCGVAFEFRLLLLRLCSLNTDRYLSVALYQVSGDRLLSYMVDECGE